MKLHFTARAQLRKSHGIKELREQKNLKLIEGGF
jgi:hypothetical protein